MSRAVFITLVLALAAVVKCRSCECGHQTNQSTNAVTLGLGESTNVSLLGNESSSRSVLIPSLQDDELRRYSQLYFIVAGILKPMVNSVGIAGNTLSVVVLAKGAFKSSSVVYLFVIALIDLVYQILSSPWNFTAFQSITNTLSWKTFYSFYIPYVFPLVYVCYTVSVWMVVVFAVERFVMVVYPLKKHLVHQNQAKRIVGAVAVFAALINAPRFLERAPYLTVDPETNKTYYTMEFTDLSRSLSYTSVMFWSSFVLNIALPFVLLGVFNSLIVYYIRLASKRAIHLVSNVADQSNDARGSRDAQITRLLFGIVIAFFLCNSVGAVMNVLVGIYGRSFHFKTWFRTGVLIADVLFSANPTMNFIVYTTCSSAMRKTIGELLGCSRRSKMERSSSRT